MLALPSEGFFDVALVSGEEDGGAVAAADCEKFRVAVPSGPDGGFHVKASCVKEPVAEAVERTETLVRGAVVVVSTARGFLAGTGGGELDGVAEDEVGGAVGVDGVVFAEGVEAGAVAAEGHGGDAKGTPIGVAGQGRCEGDGRAVLVVAAGVHGADVPELDAGVGFARCEEEVFPTRRKELESGDGDFTKATRYLAYPGHVDVTGAGKQIASLFLGNA